MMHIVGEHGPETMNWNPYQNPYQGPVHPYDQIRMKHRNMVEQTIADDFAKRAMLYWFMFCIARIRSEHP